MKCVLSIIVLSAILFFHALPSGASSQERFDSLCDQIKSLVQSLDTVSASHGTDMHREAFRQLTRVYDRRKYKPIWLDLQGLLPQGALALQTLRQCAKDGAPGLIDHLDGVEQMLEDGLGLVRSGLPVPSEELARLDVSFTRIVILYAFPIKHHYQTSFNGSPSTADNLYPRLKEVLGPECMQALEDAVKPFHAQYQALQNSLQKYENIKLLGGWPQIQSGPAMHLGRRDRRVPLLRWRLVISGDMSLDQLSADETFDADLSDAVEKYQARHGLDVDGVVGKRTRVILNVPVEDRIMQIETNLERWRRLPAKLGSRYLMVNVPNFQLDIVENNTVVKSIRAIVGKRDRRTPILSTEMTYLELNPYWNVPQKIARRDILPKIQKNPQFLVQQRFEVFDSWKTGARELDPLGVDWYNYSEKHFPFRLRQRPTRSNALGKIKFVFPNRYSVYIHDTPGKALFERNKRSYSSGCIRIEEPLALAEYLLKDQRWSRSKIIRGVQANKRKVIVLRNPIPVHLVYFTTWIDGAGTIHFREDLYDRDRCLYAQMARRHLEDDESLSNGPITHHKEPGSLEYLSSYQSRDSGFKF